MTNEDEYKPAQVIEETRDYQVLDWGDDGQGLYCMNCAWISFEPLCILNRYCPVCKQSYQTSIV